MRDDLPQAHSALITLLFAQKNVDAATKQLEQLKKILPNHPQTQFFEAQSAFARSDFLKARELLQPLLRASPNHVGLLHLAGATEFMLNAYSQAESLLVKVIQLAPNFPAARRLLAQVHLRSQQPAKAQVMLRPLVEKGMMDSEALTLMAEAVGMQGDAKAADEYLARAVQIKPDDRRILAAQALGQVARGNADAALNQLVILAAADKGPAVDLALIGAHLRRNELPRALAAIDALDKKLPGGAVAPNLRGRVQLQQNDAPAARKSFELAVSREPKFIAAAAALAAMDLAEQKPDAAKARFEAVLKADPKNSQAMMALSELVSRSGGTPEQAVKWLKDAVAADPTNAAAHMALIEHHLRLRQTEAALGAAQAAVAALPEQPDLLERQARAQLAAGESRQALSTFTRVAQLRPDSAVSFINLGEAQASANDLDGAARSAKRALELTPDSVPAQRLTIALAVKQKRWKDALDLARDMQTRRPTEASGALFEGEVELEQRNFDNAIVAFRKASAMANPAQSAVRVHEVLLMAKRDAEAAKWADSWAAAHPKDSMFAFYLGDVALGQGDLALAERRYSEVLKVQPEHALALNNIAWIMAQQRRPGAVALAERAVKGAPEQPPLMDTLALALAAEAQLPRALEIQRRVVAMAPDAPSFRLNLAKMQLQAGDKPSARLELEKLAKLGAKFSSQAEVAQLMKAAASP